MLACTRLARRVCRPRPSWRTATRLALIRHNSSLAPDPPVDGSSAAPNPPANENAEDADEDNDKGYEAGNNGPLRDISYSEFKETVGEDYQHASPRNWLGGEVPFPMNPSFIPPAPISDALRTKIYQEFMRDPKENSVRALSQTYHISMKRVDAILRLKGLENAWVKGKQLQTGFQQGMEKLLGVDQEIRNRQELGRRDVHEADILEQDENRDAIRQRYQRLYWESVPESRGEPIVPGVLELAKQQAKQFANRAEGFGNNRMPRIEDTEYIKTPQEKVQVVTKDDRPSFVFHDVGGKFIDRKEHLYRTAIAQRRARVKMVRRDRKEDGKLN